MHSACYHVAIAPILVTCIKYKNFFAEKFQKSKVAKVHKVQGP